MPKSPDEMMVSMIENLKEKTGKSLDDWLKIAKTSKLAKHGEIVKHLKEKHDLTHGYANLVAHKFLGSDAGSAEYTDDLVTAQYAGPKASLRPIYDALLMKITSFGSDVEVSPKKTYVSLRRSKQFAIVQPSTATRLDVGINLKGLKPSGRLEASGSFNAMVSHRVKLEKAGDIDAELIGWLKQAYEAA
jgi:predicted transport protein